MNRKLPERCESHFPLPKIRLVVGKVVRKFIFSLQWFFCHSKSLEEQ